MLHGDKDLPPDDAVDTAVVAGEPQVSLQEPVALFKFDVVYFADASKTLASIEGNPRKALPHCSPHDSFVSSAIKQLG